MIDKDKTLKQLILRSIYSEVDSDNRIISQTDMADKIMDELKGLLPEKLPEYTDNPNETNGIYSHTDKGKRWYNLDFNQGVNWVLEDIHERLGL